MLDITLQQMQYALEIARTGSISQAARNLYMNQPNLSKAIKDLEGALGISVFERTPKGVLPTREGRVFLEYADGVLGRVEELEEKLRTLGSSEAAFNISIPRASYITYAFTEFIREIQKYGAVKVNYRETNTMEAVDNILHRGFHLGIIRYPSVFQQDFQQMLERKALKAREIWEFRNMVLLSADDPAAGEDTIRLNDLENYTELVHGDAYVPFISRKEYNRLSRSPKHVKRIFLYERGSQFDLLRNVPSTFMWVSPLPQDMLQQYHLAQRLCPENNVLYKDILISREDYQMTGLDECFLKTLTQVRQEIEQSAFNGAGCQQ